MKIEKWTIGPPQVQDVYDFEDALVVGTLICTMLKHADRLKIACLAQLVNVIAPIMTENGGAAWRQTIFYPFMHASRYGRGVALNVQISCAGYSSAKFGEVPFIETVATMDEANETLTIFAVNRNSDGPLLLEAEIRSFPGYQIVEHIVLESPDTKASNTRDYPDSVVPHSIGSAKMSDGKLTAQLPKLSWNVIRLSGKIEAFCPSEE